MVTMWFLGHSVVFLGRGSRCGFFFFDVFCGFGGFGWWLVAVMVGGCGGCVIGGWMWWPAVLRIVGLRKKGRIKNE